MTEEATATIDPKDITYDVILDDTDERPGRDAPGASSDEPKGDHPCLVILDMAFKQSGVYLKKQGLPPANNDVYENFSKPFLNEAAWHYLPDGSLPDDPRFALVVGVAGLGLAFAPTLIALYERKETEEKRRKEEEKRRREVAADEEKTEEKKPDVPPGPVAAPPDWMTRLESGALSGM